MVGIVEELPRWHSYLVRQQGSHSGLTHKPLSPFTATHLANDNLPRESGSILEQTPNYDSPRRGGRERNGEESLTVGGRKNRFSIPQHGWGCATYKGPYTIDNQLVQLQK